MEWKVTDDATGAPVSVGDRLRTFRDEECELLAVYQPGTTAGGMTGRVKVRLDGRECVFYPKVVNVTINPTG